MKLHQHEDTEGNRITGCGAGWFAVNGQRHDRPCALAAQLLCELEPQTSGIAALLDAAEPTIGEFAPELVILGTGARFCLAPREVAERLAKRGIGLESMDTAAACRTFNLLAYEGRRVLAVLGVGDYADAREEG
ncbi:MAG: Mth938-like domain-containing protein [Betaproteobacteria bacterium]|nr:Mth938-like domain-containing protein [Betaproteobacteria bacterium]